MTSWEKFFDEKIRLLAQGTEIIDVGGAQGFIKVLAPYKGLFRNTHYQSIDISPEAKPSIVGDIHDLPLDNASVDGILCISVLEHIEHPETAFAEMLRVLKPGGRCLIYVPFLFPYHAREGAYNYKDYFRYTKDGLRYLARNFSVIEMAPVMYFFETWFYLLPNPFGRLLSKTLGRLLDVIIRPSGNQTSGHYLYLEK